MSRHCEVRKQSLAALLCFALVLALPGCGGGSSDDDVIVVDDDVFRPLPTEGFPNPTLVSDSLEFTGVTTSHHHSCALQADGRAWCWGSNEWGQLGSSAPMQRCAGDNFPCSGTPLAVDGGKAFIHLAASIRHTCGLDAAGQAWCWGFGIGGQLGDGLRENSSVPVAVTGGHRFVALTASVAGSVTCGLTAAGKPWCWGPDVDGVLGNGTRDGSTVPVPVLTDQAFISIGVGQQHACGVTTSGDAYCWGINWYGNLGVGSAGGDGGFSRSTTPLLVSGGLKFTQISAGGSHTCALAEGGKAYCWGLGYLTGTVDAASYVSMPVAVDGGTTYQALITGFSHTCALRASGQIDCWGENYAGALGNGTFVASETPVRVHSPEIFTAFAAGGGFTCAVTNNRAAWCWGGSPWGGVGQPPDDP